MPSTLNIKDEYMASSLMLQPSQSLSHPQWGLINRWQYSLDEISSHCNPSVITGQNRKIWNGKKLEGMLYWRLEPMIPGGLQSDNGKFWPFKNQTYLRKIMEYIITSSFVSGTVWIGIGCQFTFLSHIWSPSGGYNPARLLAALISVLSTSVDWIRISSREYASGRNPVYLWRSHWPNS